MSEGDIYVLGFFLLLTLIVTLTFITHIHHQSPLDVQPPPMYEDDDDIWWEGEDEE